MTMAKHPEKTMYDCFKFIKDELQRLRKSLGPSANDEMMRMKLIRACEVTLACNYIAIRPPETLKAFVNDLRAATSSYDRLHPDRASEAMMTDRKYFNYRRQSNGHANTQTEHSKECKVCHKTGCWSTNHSVDERIKTYNEYREKQRHRRSQSPKAFMMELQEFIFDLELEPDAFVLTNQKAQNPDDELQLMPTQSNQVYMANSRENELFTTYANQAVMHAIQGQKPLPNSPHILHTRYGADHFNGIMIDTGASYASFAGYKQCLAFSDHMWPVPIDESKKGMPFAFGIGGARSMGTITVATPIGTITFHVVDADVPFLLSLDDLDQSGFFFNNQQDMFINKEGIAIAVTRWNGHLFLRWKAPRMHTNIA